jgi:hypothetical protein
LFAGKKYLKKMNDPKHSEKNHEINASLGQGVGKTEAKSETYGRH